MKFAKVSIPPWNAIGLLPPIDPEIPTIPYLSPYRVSLKDLVMRFSTSPERQAVLKGFLSYRKELYRIGIQDGIQWIDGSFLEDVEKVERRAARDIDVVSFCNTPPNSVFPQRTLRYSIKPLQRIDFVLMHI